MQLGALRPDLLPLKAQSGSTRSAGHDHKGKAVARDPTAILHRCVLSCRGAHSRCEPGQGKVRS
jgi:hypothetical protein